MADAIVTPRVGSDAACAIAEDFLANEVGNLLRVAEPSLTGDGH